MIDYIDKVYVIMFINNLIRKKKKKNCNAILSRQTVRIVGPADQPLRYKYYLISIWRISIGHIRKNAADINKNNNSPCR